MKEIQVPVGISDFREIIEEDLYFVDKTIFIKELLSTKGEKVTLFTRPRRFGKTLCMSMLSEFFDIRKDSEKLFSKLNIAKEKDICDNWMNKYPTIFITLKSVNGLKFEDAYAMLVNIVSQLFKQHLYLLESSTLDDGDKIIFKKIIAKKASYDEFNSSLKFLAALLKIYYDKPVMLFIDEYDVPIAKADQNGYYREMIDVIGAMLSVVLKDNVSLKRAVITGCLKIAKESIFTGTNNFVSDTIINSRYDEYFGFTEKEVKKLLSDCNLENHFADIKEWYDGYKFGNADIYCPWDVMNYVNELSRDIKAKPKAYWNNTSGNDIVKKLIKNRNNRISERIETLMSGGYIKELIDTSLTYDRLYASKNIWSVMYFTGYLTKATLKEGDHLEKRQVALRIPNNEVLEIFETTVVDWFNDYTSQYDMTSILSAIWNKQADVATMEITKILRKTISYHDYREDFYHAFLAGIFAGAGYAVESNREHGDGRSDVVVSDIENGRVAVFEVKYSKRKDDLQADCEKAIDQMNTKRYAEEFYDDYDEVFCYGISFFRKQCKVMVHPKS